MSDADVCVMRVCVCDAGVCVMRVFVSYASVLLEGVIKDKERKFYA